MLHILDTTIISALMQGEPAAARHLVALRPSDVLVPQPALAEIEYGLARLPRSKRRSALEGRFRELAAALRRAEWTDEVSTSFGSLKAQLEQAGARIDDFDVAIAAHAVVRGAIVVTRNTRHFGRVPDLAVETWLE